MTLPSPRHQTQGGAINAYKVTICNSPGWRGFTTCTLGVSVPSPNWQGERFASILDFASARFSSIRIDVADSLYRHNFLAQGLSLPEAEARAQALGASWLAEHGSIIDACPVKPEVVRWAEWYAHPDFTDVLDQFRSSLDRGTALHGALENDLKVFFRRQGHEPNGAQREQATEFLLEELAVLTLQARSTPGLRIYPGEQLACMRVVSQGLVPDAPRGLELEQFAQVNLRSRRNPDAASEFASAPLLPTAPDQLVRPGRAGPAQLALP